MSGRAFVPPTQQRYRRACIVCSIIQTDSVRASLPPQPALPLRTDRKANDDDGSQRFRDEGCPNCDDFLHLTNSQDQIEACTSQVFEGVITLSNPNRSWVAKWQRLDGYVPGIYAIKVSGQLPDEIRQVIEDEYRIQYIP